MRRLLVLPVLALLLLLAACTPTQYAAWGSLNGTRVVHGLEPLYWDQTVADEATRRAQILIANDVISHLGFDNVNEWLTPGTWDLVGENVGAFWEERVDGRPVEEWIDAFLASPSHRANVLNPAYTHIGIGHASAADGRIFVVYLFWAAA